MKLGFCSVESTTLSLLKSQVHEVGLPVEAALLKFTVSAAVPLCLFAVKSAVARVVAIRLVPAPVPVCWSPLPCC